MSSAICLNLVQSKILLSHNRLKEYCGENRSKKLQVSLNRCSDCSDIMLETLLNAIQPIYYFVILTGASLEQMHIFVLAHILRRPIIVYGVKVVKSYKGENIDYARFEGEYSYTFLNCRHFVFHQFLCY